MTRPQEFSHMARPGQVLIKFTAGPPGPGQATPILSLLDQQGAMVQLAVIDKGPCGPPKKEGGNPVKAGSAPRCCARKDLDYSRGWLDRKMAQKPGRTGWARGAYFSVNAGTVNAPVSKKWALSDVDRSAPVRLFLVDLDYRKTREVGRQVYVTDADRATGEQAAAWLAARLGTVPMSSGNGIQVLAACPWDGDAKGYLQGLDSELQEEFPGAGLKIDPTHNPDRLARLPGYRHESTGKIAGWPEGAEVSIPYVELEPASPKAKKASRPRGPGPLKAIPAAAITAAALEPLRALVASIALSEPADRQRLRLAVADVLVDLGVEDLGSHHQVSPHDATDNCLRTTLRRRAAGETTLGAGEILRLAGISGKPTWDTFRALARAKKHLVRALAPEAESTLSWLPRQRGRRGLGVLAEQARAANSARTAVAAHRASVCGRCTYVLFDLEGEVRSGRVRCETRLCAVCASLDLHGRDQVARESWARFEKVYLVELKGVWRGRSRHDSHSLVVQTFDTNGERWTRYVSSDRAIERTSRANGGTYHVLTAGEAVDRISEALAEDTVYLQGCRDIALAEERLQTRTYTNSRQPDVPRWPSREDRREWVKGQFDTPTDRDPVGCLVRIDGQDARYQTHPPGIADAARLVSQAEAGSLRPQRSLPDHLAWLRRCSAVTLRYG